MAAAAAFQSLAAPRNLAPNLHGSVAPRLLGSRPSSRSYSCNYFRLESAVGFRRRLGTVQPRSSKREFWIPIIGVDQRVSRVLPVGSAASHEESHSEIEVEKKKNDAEVKAEVSQEAWKESLEYFKVEAFKVKAMSEEAYQVYSKKAIEVLMDTSKKLKIQADKAQHDLSIIMEEVSEEGKEYLSAAAKNSPDSVKDIVETYASVDELKTISEVRDFYLGIPYGSFLVIGGFLNFMLSGSIPAIRFGVILGSAILALSVASLRSWKQGKPTPLLLKVQTAIAAIIFLRQWLLCSQRGSFPGFLMLLISAGMLAFYVYRIIIDRRSKDASMGQSSES